MLLSNYSSLHFREKYGTFYSTTCIEELTLKSVAVVLKALACIPSEDTLTAADENILLD